MVCPRLVGRPAFAPEVERAYIKRIEFVFTPKHGS